MFSGASEVKGVKPEKSQLLKPLCIHSVNH